MNCERKKDNVPFYHYDRSGKLEPGMSLELSKDFGPIEERLQGSSAFLRKHFPDGLSKHGLQYLSLFEESVIDCDPQKTRDAFAPLNSHLIEHTLELTRRAFFPKYQSRLQSVFCLPSPSDISDWPELNSAAGKLFEIDDYRDFDGPFDSYWLRGGITVHDDGFLTWSAALDFDCAYKYWAGVRSDHPRLEVLVKPPVRIGRDVSLER